MNNYTFSSIPTRHIDCIYLLRVTTARIIPAVYKQHIHYLGGYFDMIPLPVQICINALCARNVEQCE